MSRVLGWAILSGLTAAAPLGAQDIASTARRLDSTNHALIAVRDSLVAYRKAHPASYGQYDDSVVIAGGRVKVLFNEDQASVSRAAAAVADKALAEFGSALNRVGPFVFSIVPDSALNSYDAQLRRTQAISVRQHLAGDPANPNHTSAD